MRRLLRRRRKRRAAWALWRVSTGRGGRGVGACRALLSWLQGGLLRHLHTVSPAQDTERFAKRTLKAQVLRQVECRMLPSNRVLCETAARRHHLVEAGNTIPLLELPHVGANTVHNSRNVIAAVGIVIWH